MSTIVGDDGHIIDPYRAFIAVSRYSRWLDKENRRETWEETVSRYINFMHSHVDKNHGGAIDDKFWSLAKHMILTHQVMPSMRALMTAGQALERENLAQYNCSFIAVNDVRSFDEGLYILMNGVGLGFSVEAHHIVKLPVINEHFEPSESTIVVEDSKAGWAKALRELIAMLYAGQVPLVDITRLRPAGARLKTFGGRASGPQPLVNLFDFVIEKFRNAAGRRLTSLECHDIMCKIGEVVVVGGVRRSALISMSDLSDYDMAKAKSGAWWESNAQRALANNSAVYNKRPSVGEFAHEWGNLYDSKSGERGIINLEGLRKYTNAPRRDLSRVEGLNPCSEILLRDKGLCNLTEVIIRPQDTLETITEKVEVATVLGTIQSSLTSFKYLRKIWSDNARDERLLGVSLTGQMGHKVLSGSAGASTLEDWLKPMRQAAIDKNAETADALDIEHSVAITTVKPSGTVSQLTYSSPGMHAWHSPYYLRAVRGDNKDPLTKMLKDMQLPNEPDVTNPDNMTVFYFPMKSPEGALCRDDLTAVEHLNIWKAYKVHWTEHNPSVTITVREHEWFEVLQWVYENWDSVGGISFLPHSDHTYKQAPYQEVDQTTYNQFIADMPGKIHWGDLSYYENEDSTSGAQTLACTSSACELVDISA